jgi:hypothetical protein
MRRRLDIPPLPFLEPDGAMYHLNFDGTLVPYQEDTFNAADDDEGQELSAMPSTSRSVARDYVARARYLVGNQSQDADANSSSLSALEARRTVAKLERAVSELREGLLGEFLICQHLSVVLISVPVGDDDADRKIQAEVLLNAYSRELDRRRLQAGISGIIITDEGTVVCLYLNDWLMLLQIAISMVMMMIALANSSTLNLNFRDRHQLLRDRLIILIEY